MREKQRNPPKSNMITLKQVVSSPKIDSFIREGTIDNIRAKTNESDELSDCAGRTYSYGGGLYSIILAYQSFNKTFRCTPTPLKSILFDLPDKINDLSASYRDNK